MARSRRPAAALTQIVGYLRTSTEEQVISIDAQQDKVDSIARARGCTVPRWFTEHESGGNNARPELDRAIRHARRIRAALCVAKLDRLARDQQFLMKLYDGNVPIIFGDFPEVDGSPASRVMVQMLASFAEFERERMKERMRDWHKQRQIQGLSSGHPPNMTRAGREKGAAAAAAGRTAAAIDEMADIAEIAAAGVARRRRWSEIAAHLNAEGYLSRRGKPWRGSQVRRVYDRAKAAGKLPASPGPGPGAAGGEHGPRGEDAR